jgi:cyclopropane-fatty-acyl-phospholipid synthase
MQLEGLPIPRFVLCAAARYLIRQRLKRERQRLVLPEIRSKLFSEIKSGPIAVQTQKANEQHYEVPAKFYTLALGPNRKYSSCLYQDAQATLEQAELAMLALYVERAQIVDGQRIMDLGCGWGSLSLYLARRFPNCKIIGVSNSRLQKEYIDQIIASEQIHNLEIRTADINGFEFDQKVDRIVSIEMFEHLRNYQLLFQKILSWLEPNGKIFVHIFCHRDLIYFFEEEGASNWMGRHFFSGGIMPNFDLFSSFNEQVTIEKSWKVSGVNYYRTALDWEKNLFANREQVMQLFKAAYGAQAKLQFKRWQLFFIACQELFRFADGNEWFVGHYLLTPKG